MFKAHPTLPANLFDSSRLLTTPLLVAQSDLKSVSNSTALLCSALIESATVSFITNSSLQATAKSL